MAKDAGGLGYRTVFPDDGPADAIVTFHGVPRVDDVVRLVGRLQDEPWRRRETALVIDFSACDTGPSLTGAEARGLAARLNGVLGRLAGKGAVAIVAADAAAFGMLRMTLSYQEIDADRTGQADGDFPIRACTSMDEALGWLASRRPASR